MAPLLGLCRRRDLNDVIVPVHYSERGTAPALRCSKYSVEECKGGDEKKKKNLEKKRKDAGDKTKATTDAAAGRLCYQCEYGATGARTSQQQTGRRLTYGRHMAAC